MKNILFVILLFSIFSCGKNEDQTNPKPQTNDSGLTKEQLATIFPVTDAVLNEGRLYFILQKEERQFMGVTNSKKEYAFQYYEHKVEFTARMDGNDVYVNIKGVEWKVRIEKP